MNHFLNSEALASVERDSDGGTAFRMRLAASVPFFDGHFPGSPVLPGIAHLAAIEEALSEVLGSSMRMTSLDMLRLRSTILPDQSFELRVAKPEQGSGGEFTVRWTVRSDRVRVAEGRGRARRMAPAQPGAAQGDQRDRARISDDYLPHRGAARLVGDILVSTPDSSLASVSVPASSAFVRGGHFPAYLAAEIGAQCAAASEAKLRSEEAGESEVKAGYVVRVADLRFEKPSLDAARPMTVRAELVSASPPLRNWRCTLESSSGVLATGSVSTFAGAS